MMKKIILLSTLYLLTIHTSAQGNSKYEITMKLAKDTYKKYEPVIAEFELINHDSKPMDIYDLFETDLEGPAIMITDENGHKTSDNKEVPADVMFTGPMYTILPGDTLFVSMPINDWGTRVKTTSNIYFDQVAYFLPGTYNAYYYFDKYQSSIYRTSLKSNEVEFEVTDDNSEDIDVLKLYHERKFEEIISEYKKSQFLEHIYAAWILHKHNTIFSNPGYSRQNELESDYENFFKKYPDSFYILKDRFLSPYIYKFLLDNSSPEAVITNIKQRVSNDMLNKFLSNKKRVEDHHKIQK